MVKIFGTDGIRGKANVFPITSEVAMKFGMAAGHFFKKDEYRHRVVIAKDTRISGYMLEPALTSGFISVGMDVILVGPMPTPAVPMLIKSLRADLGVMISASHNPYQDNGLKLFNSEGYKLTDNLEKQLQEMMFSEELPSYLVTPDQLGRAKRLDDASGRYVEHVKRSFPRGMSLKDLRIVIDCANGAGYHLAPNILWELGAEVIKIGCEPDGFNINQGCGSTSVDALAKKVVETRADIGIALDGDADRVVICDEKGKVVAGDHVIGAIAQSMQEQSTLGGNGVVVTQMSNGALDKFLAGLGLKTYRALIGDRYVSEKMREHNCNLGGEQSGHIIFGDYSTTGDGIVCALQLLAFMVKKQKPISELVHLFELNPQIIRNIKFNTFNPLEDRKINTKLSAIQDGLKDLRILVRKSGTEKLIRVMVEGENMLKINTTADEIEQLLVSNL
jgi:phosphoglucosamine mutase